MKNLLIRLLAAIVTLGSVSAQQKTITVPLPESLADKAWVKSYVDSVRKADTGTIPPPVVKPAGCQAGPEITAITEKSVSGIKVQFHGVNVFKVVIDIYTPGGTRVFSDTISPGSSVLPVVFKTLFAPGTYKLFLRGVSCTGEDSESFDIPNTGSGGNDQPVPDAGGSTTFPLRTLAKGMDEHMKLVIRDSADVRLISDVSTEARGSNYNYRYLIGGDILTQKSKLTNYIAAGNNPLRIVKFKLKNGISSINQWGTGQEEYVPGGYYQSDAGEVFSYNTSFAFNTFIASGAPQQAGFLNHIPQNYDPASQQPSWTDIGSDIKLPAGHVWIADWQGSTPENVFKKGVTNLPHHSLPWNDADGNRQALALKAAGKTYNNVPRIEVIFNLSRSGPEGLWPNGTSKAWWPNGALDTETAIRKANEADISDAIWIGEMSENESWMPADADMFRPFYARLRERYQEKWGSKGVTYQIVHNYFFIWPREISLTRDKSADYYRKLLSMSAAELPKTPYSPGGTLANTTMITDAVYLNAPDIQNGGLYESIFRTEINKHLGFESGTFLFAVHEYRPNNKYEYYYNEGKFYADNKIPLDPNVHIAAGFLAQVYGKLFTEWGASSKSSEKRFDPEWNKGWWFPNGSSSAQGGFPYYKNSSSTYYGFTGGSDLSYFSQKLYAETFGQTDGGQRRYLRHRIDGKDWITPSLVSCEEVVNAYIEKRGFVLSESKNGKTAWFYLNSFTDNKFHTLEVELPSGQILSRKVAGNGIHAMIL
jgi:hypothetical protein